MDSSPTSQTNPTKALNPFAIPFLSKTKTSHNYYACYSTPQVLFPHQFFYTLTQGPFVLCGPQPTLKICMQPPRSTSRVRRSTRTPPRAKVWIKKRTSKEKSMERVRSPDDVKARSIVFPFPCNLSNLERSRKTTVMIKNIPNQFGRQKLLDILDEHCKSENRRVSGGFASQYDFVYLPMDFNKYWVYKKTSNLGYAFVNFTSAFGAWRFYKSFNNYDWRVPQNNKVCEVTLAKIQGLVALRESFQSKIFFCHSDEYLPVMFSPPCDGTSAAAEGVNIGQRMPITPRHPLKKSTRVLVLKA